MKRSRFSEEQIIGILLEGLGYLPPTANPLKNIGSESGTLGKNRPTFGIDGPVVDGAVFAEGVDFLDGRLVFMVAVSAGAVS